MGKTGVVVAGRRGAEGNGERLVSVGEKKKRTGCSSPQGRDGCSPFWEKKMLGFFLV